MFINVLGTHHVTKRKYSWERNTETKAMFLTFWGKGEHKIRKKDTFNGNRRIQGTFSLER